MRSMKVFKYTSCVAQRTRLRRTKFQEFVNGSNRRRKKRSVHNKVKELELNDSSSKRDCIKRSRKTVSCSKKYLDEIGASNSENFYTTSTCSTDDTIAKGKGWVCMDLEAEHSFYPENTDRSFEDEDVEVFPKYDEKITKRAVKIEDAGFEDFKVERTRGNNHGDGGASVGSFNMIKNKNSTEIEEIVVSSDSDVCVISSDSENDDSNVSEFSVESSFDLEDVKEKTTEEMNSKHESEMSEDKGEHVEKEALEVKDIPVEDPMVEEIVVSSCDDWDDIFSPSDDEDKDTCIEEIVISSDDACDELSNCGDEKSEDADDSDDSDFAVEAKEQKKYTTDNACDELSSCGDEESESVDESDDSDFSVESKNQKQSKTSSANESDDSSVVEPYSKRTGSNEKMRKNLVSEKEGNVNIHGPKYECFDLDEHVHRKRPSIAVKKENPTKKRKNSAEKSENILNSILDRGEIFQEEWEARQPLSGLPLKFRFDDEDEDPRKVEKSEFDLMVDGLFAESEYALKCEEMGFSESQEAENEKEDDDLETEENQYLLCSKGRHQPYVDEQIGIICHFCKQILLESKHVLPPLMMNFKTGSSERAFSPDRNDNPTPTLEDLMQLFYGESENDDGFWNHEEGTVWDMIPGTRERIYPHQREGFEFLWKSLMGTIKVCDLKNSDPYGVGGCIISHAPGTGKTRLTLLFLESFLKLYPYSLPVIIAPASVLLTWEEEFRKWGVKFPFYNLNNLNLVQNKDVSRAEELKKWHKGKSILGVSYNLYEKLAGEKFMKATGKKNKVKLFVSQKVKKLRKILLELPGLVVLDEGHTPRNKRSSIWNTIVKINTKKRVILSGTPFQNNFEELYNTLRLVRPDTAEALSEKIDFMDMIKVRKGRQQRKQGTFLCNSNGKVSDEVIKRLKMTIAPFVHVHRGSILKESLPGLRDSVIFLNPPELQKVLIDSIEVNKGTFEFEHKVALVSLHPSLLLHSSKLTEKQKSIVTKEELKRLRLKPDEGVKMRFLRKFIPLCLIRNEKVLIFSQFKEPLNFIKEQLGDILDGDFEKKVLQLDGTTNHGQRQILIKEFNDQKSEAKIMLASTKCCSEGISLVGASRVILLDVVWNPSVERQAICRAYRLSQKKVVYTYHLITCGTTEWEKYCRQAEKDRLSELVFFSSTCKEDGGQKKNSAVFDDVILDDMVNHPKLMKMFEKIIYQPKEKNLFDSFSMIS